MRKIYLFMLMAVGLLISGNAGAEEVQVSTEAQFKTAIATATNEVVLQNDLELTATQTIKCVSVDLNGHTISFSKAGINLAVSATSTIKNGTIRNDYGTTYLLNVTGTPVTFDNVKMYCQKSGYALYVNKASAEINLNNGTELVGPAKYTSAADANAQAGGAIFTNSTLTLNIDANTTISGNMQWATVVTLNNAGSLTIKGGNLSAAHVISNTGTLNIEGGRFATAFAESSSFGSNVSVTSGLFITANYTTLQSFVNSSSSVVDSKISDVADNKLNAKQILPEDFSESDYVMSVSNDNKTYNFTNTLDALSAAGTNGKKISLLKDADLLMSKSFTTGTEFDLNNKKLTYLGNFYLQAATTVSVTIKNGELINNVASLKVEKLIYSTLTTGTFTLENVTGINKYTTGYAIQQSGTMTTGKVLFKSGCDFSDCTRLLNVTANSIFENEVEMVGSAYVTNGKTVSWTNTNGGTLKLNGGFVNETLAAADYIADGYKATPFYDATYKDCYKIVENTEPVVAKIGNYEYATFAAAITGVTNAMKKVPATHEDSVIVLQEGGATFSANTTLPNGCILDLNGQTLSSTGKFYLSCGSADNAKVTIKDGTIYSEGATYALLINSKTGLKVDLQNVKIETPNNYPIQLNTANKSNTLTIDANCELMGKTYAMYVTEACTPTINNYATLTQNIYATDGPSLTINNYGTIPGISWSKANAKNHTFNNEGTFTFNPSSLSGTIMVTGTGTFNLVNANYTNIDLPSGATYNAVEGTIIAATDKEDVGAAPAGLKWVDILYNNVAACQLVDENAEPVCQIGTHKYYGLQVAFDAVPNETKTTIQMIGDINLDFTSETSYYSIASNKMIVLDLNNHSIIASRDAANGDTGFKLFSNAGDLTVTDESTEKQGKILLKTDNTGSSNNGWCLLSLTTGSNFTLNNGTLRHETPQNGICYVIDASGSIDIVINGGSIERNIITDMRLIASNATDVINFTMNGGKLEGKYGIWVQTSKGKIKAIFNNGKFVATYTGGWTFESDGGSSASNDDEIVINGGTYDSYFDLYGTESISVTGGDFKDHNAIRLRPNVATANHFISAGTFFFSQEKIKELAIAGYVQFITTDQGPVCESYYGYKEYNYYGELGTQAGWEALGYIIEQATDEEKAELKSGDWCRIYKMTEPVEDFNNFKKLIAEGYAAVDITGQSDGNGGTWPDKTVIVTKVTEEQMSGTTEWAPEATNAASAVEVTSGANITIKENTTVEAYSVTVPTGSTLTVEPNATLIVGAGGVTGAVKGQPISINIGSDEGSGAIKISPDAPVSAAKPRIRVQLTTKAYTDGEGNQHWQFFARPTGMIPETFKVVEGNAAGATKHYISGYDGVTNTYTPITDFTQLGNYEGYAITNNSSTGGVVYQFEGELNPNQNAEITFKNRNFTLMGNSYLAPVSMTGLFKGIIEGVTAPEESQTQAPVVLKAPTEDGGNAVEWTVWVYDCANKHFVQTNLLQAKARNTQLQPMQGFFMKLREGSSLTAAIDYVGAVWNNNAVAGPILAPAQKQASEIATASIVISANGCEDQIDLFEDAEFDNTFNNGADASKLMNLQGMFNLYAQTEAGTLACVASDNIEGTTLTFQANNASEYELTFNNVNMNYSLIDLTTGAIIAMNEGNVYTFNAEPNSTEARFQIVKAAQAPTNMDKVVNKKATKGIYSMTGAYLGEAKDFNALPQGVYVVNGEKIVK